MAPALSCRSGLLVPSSEVSDDFCDLPRASKGLQKPLTKEWSVTDMELLTIIYDLGIELQAVRYLRVCAHTETSIYTYIYIHIIYIYRFTWLGARGLEFKVAEGS